MKLSQWIAELQADMEQHGDKELLDMPAGWLEDVVPDELARWLLLNDWVSVTLLPEGLLVPGVLDADPSDEELPTVATKLEDAVMTLADDATDRAQIIESLRRALAALGA